MPTGPGVNSSIFSIPRMCSAAFARSVATANTVSTGALMRLFTVKLFINNSGFHALRGNKVAAGLRATAARSWIEGATFLEQCFQLGDCLKVFGPTGGALHC